MKNYRFNGERWVCDTRPVLNRIRQWLVWVGGWELARGGWDTEGPATPIALLGHRVTIFDWGVTMRTSEGVLTVVFNEAGKPWRGIARAFISQCGTPNHAHVWLVGTPPAIVNSVETRAVA